MRLGGVLTRPEAADAELDVGCGARDLRCSQPEHSRAVDSAGSVAAIIMSPCHGRPSAGGSNQHDNATGRWPNEAIEGPQPTSGGM